MQECKSQKNLHDPDGSTPYRDRQSLAYSTAHPEHKNEQGFSCILAGTTGHLMITGTWFPPPGPEKKACICSIIVKITQECILTGMRSGKCLEINQSPDFVRNHLYHLKG